jgi:hypothetical protein
MKSLRPLSLLLVIFLSGLNTFAQNKKSKSMYFLAGFSLNSLAPSFSTDGMGAGFTGECGYRIKKHCVSFQWMGRASGSLFYDLDASSIYSFAYGYRVASQSRMSVDLHTGIGMEQFDDPRKPFNKGRDLAIPVYGTFNFTFSKKAEQHTDLWFGLRAGYHLAGQRTLRFAQLHMALVIPH